jgi:hypothetical protein
MGKDPSRRNGSIGCVSGFCRRKPASHGNEYPPHPHPPHTPPDTLGARARAHVGGGRGWQGARCGWIGFAFSVFTDQGANATSQRRHPQSTAVRNPPPPARARAHSKQIAAAPPKSLTRPPGCLALLEVLVDALLPRPVLWSYFVVAASYYHVVCLTNLRPPDPKQTHRDFGN